MGRRHEHGAGQGVVIDDPADLRSFQGACPQIEVAAASRPPRSATLRELGLHVDAPPPELREAEPSDPPWGDDGDAEP